MKTKNLFGAIIAVFAASCANATEPDNYSLNVNLSPDEDGMTVYITDYDNGNKIDSAIVDNGTAKFSGNIKSPFYGRLLMEGERIGDLIIEQANINWTPATHNLESNGVLNKRLEAMQNEMSELISQFRALPNDSTANTTRAEIINKYNTLVSKTMEDNIDNALGYVLFADQASSLDLKELDAAIAKYPQFANSERVKRARKHLLVREETSVGRKYKDFVITNDGKSQKLSDYVGNDHYTLVDFWASWCGPCIRETEVIKKLYEKYNGKGLEFLGVAVWDEPENTKRAIEKHNLPWNMIINAQTIPTDLYGISGIPCIILIAPDGTIVSRDKQDEELIADVEAAMEKYNESKK